MTSDPARIDTGNATGAAQAIAQLVPDLDIRSARDLARLLGHAVAAPNRARIREARLGLLVEMLSWREGASLPSEDEYNALAAQRAEDGEHWPTSRTLRSAYGHWLKAVQAASNHLRGYNESGGRMKVPASNAHGRRHRRYTRQDVLDDIKRARLAIGDWPTEWEYEEYTRCIRLVARRQGQPPPRIAGIKQIRAHFGSYPSAAKAAQRFWATREG